jgi:hypothetical protein
MCLSRQTHVESASIFYGENTFCLYSPDNSEVVAWIEGIGERNRQFLRNLKVDFRWGYEQAHRDADIRHLINELFQPRNSQNTYMLQFNPFCGPALDMLQKFQMNTEDQITRFLRCLSVE